MPCYFEAVSIGENKIEKKTDNNKIISININIIVIIINIYL